MTTTQPLSNEPQLASGAILCAVPAQDKAKALKEATAALDELLANPQLASALWWTKCNKLAKRIGEAMFVA